MNREEMLKRLANGEDPLELSIEKWRDIEEGKGRDNGIGNCALCHLYTKENECDECPVKAKTGIGYCMRTPYIEWFHIQREWEKENGWTDVPLGFRPDLARAERLFLESLRKKDEREMNTLVTKTKWNCEKCKKSGTMITPAHVGFWRGYEQLKVEHYKVSPDCEFDRFKIRLILVDEPNREGKTK